jgi:[histone H3]-dimethyl-L-lysine9 demethylase
MGKSTIWRATLTSSDYGAEIDEVWPHGQHVKHASELQSARCMSSKYRDDKLPRCVSCIRRGQGDTCRFQGIRFILKDECGRITGACFTSKSKKRLESPKMEWPMAWNIPMEPAHIQTTKVRLTDMPLVTRSI